MRSVLLLILEIIDLRCDLLHSLHVARLHRASHLGLEPLALLTHFELPLCFTTYLPIGRIIALASTRTVLQLSLDCHGWRRSLVEHPDRTEVVPSESTAERVHSSG